MASSVGELVVLSGPFKGRRVPVSKEMINFGRDKSCDVTLEDEAASRVHAEVLNEDGKVLVRDLGSTNGTYVNDVRIEQIQLKNGDRLGVGDTVFLVELFSSPGAGSDTEPQLIFKESASGEVPTKITLNLNDTRFLQIQEGTSIPDAQRLFTLLYDFMAEISGILHRTALMERVVDHFLKTFNADRGVILLLTAEGDPGPKVIRQKEGLKGPGNIEISRTMAQELLEKKKSFLSIDAETDERLAASQSLHDMRVRSIMGVPLKLKDRVLGMAYLDKIVVGEPFSEMDLKLCTAMALQAAVCLENASLYAELLDSAEFNNSILTALASGLMVMDMNGKIIRINKAALNILRKDHASGVQNQALKAFPEWAEFYQVVESTIQTGRSEDRYEVRIRIDDELVPLGLNTTVLTDHNGTPVGVVANFRDLTHIRKLQDQLRHSQHLAALGQMAAGVAHEIRNPLNSIRGFTQLMQEATEKAGLTDPKFQEYPQIVLEEVDRMNEIVQDLLDYSRQKELTLVPVVMEELLRLLAKDVAPEFEKGQVELNLDLPPEPLPGVLGDENKLRQVFRNIFLNALQASPMKSQVSVSLRSVVGTILKKDENGTTKEFPRSEISVIISDEGEGIAPEYIGKIFDPFFTQKEVGTGLGLSISQKIVNQHGGRIEVKSKPGEGAVFRVCLPAV